MFGSEPVQQIGIALDDPAGKNDGTIKGVEYFVMVNMASLMIRGLGEMLQQSRNLAVCWKPYAERALREKGTLAEVEAEIASWRDADETRARV